jgi:two-component system, chemotaxis family, protein-glutamate methylesterase/glutaminase
MSVRVLVVDDSRFFRRRLTEMLESDPQIKVIDTAENGMEAVSKASRLKPDVITMDVEMPVMDGITATRKIMAANPTAILMFSSLTTDGARATLDALEAGAVDFLPKRFEDISNDRDEARRTLCARVHAVGKRYIRRGIASRASSVLRKPVRTTLNQTDSALPVVSRRATANAHFQPNKVKIVAIGTSTGGPVALQNVLKQLPASFAAPILLIQHMPGSFTTAFAERLNTVCAINVREAKDGDQLEPGVALLAPGGLQMEVEKRGARHVVRIAESMKNQNYKPCVDITFSSVAKCFPGSALAIILTGMGADGREGAKKIKQTGSQIWVQDEATCVVYGMPAAIVDAGLADHVLPLDNVGKALSVNK